MEIYKPRYYLRYFAVVLLANLLVLQVAQTAQVKQEVEFNKQANPVVPDNFILTDTDDLTEISGYTGNLKHLNVGTYEYYENWQTQPGVSSGTAFAGIYKIKWEELSDKPCWMELTPMALNSEMESGLNDPRGPFDKHINLCSNKNKHGNDKSLSVPGYVKAIAACTTDKKDSAKNRLKGIKLWGATLSKQSPLVVDVPGSPAKVEHTHCKKWHGKVSCPAGYIASGLKIYTHYQEDYFRGLGLKCRKVELSTTPYK